MTKLIFYKEKLKKKTLWYGKKRKWVINGRTIIYQKFENLMIFIDATCTAQIASSCHDSWCYGNLWSKIRLFCFVWILSMTNQGLLHNFWSPFTFWWYFTLNNFNPNNQIKSKSCLLSSPLNHHFSVSHVKTPNTFFCFCTICMHHLWQPPPIIGLSMFSKFNINFSFLKLVCSSTFGPHCEAPNFTPFWEGDTSASQNKGRF